MSKEQRAKQNTSILTLLFAICSLLFVILSSCDKNATDAFRRSSPAIEVDQNDEEIMRIAENARRALPTFFRKLARPEQGASNFCLKYPLNTDDGSVEPKVREQVWLGGIHIKDGAYYGVLANTAKSVDGRKKGEAIIIDTDLITDWMYIKDGKIIGGRSIKYLLEKIPEEERKEDQRKILKMFD